LEGYINELTSKGVASRIEGVLISRRMIRDEEIRLARAAGGVKGGPASWKGNHQGNLDLARAPASRSRSKSKSSQMSPPESTPTETAASPSGLAAASSNGHPRKGPRKEAQGDHPECVRHWEQGWRRTRGTDWAIQPKDAVAIARLLKLAPAA